MKQPQPQQPQLALYPAGGQEEDDEFVWDAIERLIRRAYRALRRWARRATGVYTIRALIRPPAPEPTSRA